MTGVKLSCAGLLVFVLYIWTNRCKCLNRRLRVRSGSEYNER